MFVSGTVIVFLRLLVIKTEAFLGQKLTCDSLFTGGILVSFFLSGESMGIDKVNCHRGYFGTGEGFFKDTN